MGGRVDLGNFTEIHETQVNFVKFQCLEVKVRLSSPVARNISNYEADLGVF